MDNFSDRLKQLFTKLHLTQVTAGKKLGVSQTAISSYLRGEKSPTEKVITNMAIVLNVNLYWLLLGEGPIFRDELIQENAEVKMRSPSYGPPSPKDNIKNWLDVFWEGADPDERIWLTVEIKKRFPEFTEWLKKRKE